MSALGAQMRAWRHYLHQHPECAFEENETARFVGERLHEMGYQVAYGVGGTGVVGILRAGQGGKTVAIRADMDGLAMQEQGTPAYASQTPNRMHACGHDGHMAMALGAAAMIAAERNFHGTACFVFQPAEEPGKGAQAMLDDGLLTRFAIEEIYGLHNMPGLPQGQIAVRRGAIMASEDLFSIVIQGQSTHAARPHMGRDALLVAAEIIVALQTIVARDIDPATPAVISCTELLSDGLRNVIPGRVEIRGDARNYTPQMRQFIAARMQALVTHIAAMHGATSTFTYQHAFAPTLNHDDCVAYALAAARRVVGEEHTDADTPPLLASEDFGVFLQHIPGCFAFIGSGENALPLHNPCYDFNDAILDSGARYFAELLRMRLQ